MQKKHYKTPRPDLSTQPGSAPRFTVIAPDMLGMGFSAKPRRYCYSVLGHADMHERLLEHLGVTSCHVMAHDIGVSVVQELLARRAPNDPAPAGRNRNSDKR